MRILVSAYACEPGEGSEPGTGWAWARAAAERHEVWLLTRRNLAGPIEQARRREPHLRLHPVYLDLPRWVLRWKRGLRGVHWYYPLWQLAAGRRARRLQHEVRFDLAHHLTFAADWQPVGVSRLDGVPLLWGPVGGSTEAPWRLWRWFGWRGCVAEALRALATRVARRLFARPMARRAALIVAQNHDVARTFADAAPVLVEPNVAIDPALTSTAGPAPGMSRQGRLAVFVGRLVYWKGIRLAVAALARPEAAGWSLDVYGDGPEAAALRRLAGRLGVADRIALKGGRPRAEVLAAMTSADALLLPSMRDAASWVVAEALGVGCPVVCLDRGGPAVLVDSGKGVKVPVEGDVVGGLSNALSSITTRIPPVDRWSETRLPGLLDGWYRQVLGGEPAREASQ